MAILNDLTQTLASALGVEHEVVADHAHHLHQAGDRFPTDDDTARAEPERIAAALLISLMSGLPPSKAPDLATLHQLAKEMSRRPSYRPTISKLRHSKDWRDLGALKAKLLDLTIMERNKHAKTVVLDVKAQRREGLGVVTIRPGLGAQQRGAAR